VIDFSTINRVNGSIFGYNEGINNINTGTQQQINSTLRGGFIESQGFLQKAQSFNQAAIVTGQINDFNQEIASSNTIKSINNLTRSYALTTGKQLSQQAGTGFNVNSRSSMLVREETLAVFQGQIKDTIVNAENERRATEYAAQSQQHDLRLQGQAQQLNADNARISAANKAAEIAFAGRVNKQNLARKYNTIVPTLLNNIKTGSNPWLK